MWLVPTRGRPKLAQRLLDSGFREPGALIVDEDEESSYGPVRLPYGWRRLVLPRKYLSAKLNAAVEAFPSEPWYGCLNDDHLPMTDGWEKAVISAAGEAGIAWPNDNYAERISSHVKGGELVRKLGWFACPKMKHFWLDDADELIAKVVGAKYLKDVIVSHEHVNAGRMARDRTYSERPSNAADKAAFEGWLQNEWPALRADLTAWAKQRKSIAELRT